MSAKKATRSKQKPPPRGKSTAKTGTAKPRRPRPSTILKHYTGGATLEDLKKKFGLRGKSQLAGAVLDALISMGRLPPLEKEGKKAGARRPVTVKVNRRGTIIIPKEAVDSFGAGKGQSYVVTKRGGRVTLTLKG